MFIGNFVIFLSMASGDGVSVNGGGDGQGGCLGVGCRGRRRPICAYVLLVPVCEEKWCVLVLPRTEGYCFGLWGSESEQ